MNKCDFCTLGNARFCSEKNYTSTVENNCRTATEKMKQFLTELAYRGAKIEIS